MFVAKGMAQTFAEIEPAQKHDMSHRADAFDKFVKNCLDR
jgi:XTP/dITP diphosphohydrolase